LQNTENAKWFYTEWATYIFAKYLIAWHNSNLLLTLVENEEMHFV
jgi:hypothetical protein